MRWVTGESRRLHKNELDNLYYSPDIIGVIKSRTVKWVVHVACMQTGFLWENLRRRDHLGALTIDGSVTLKWIFKKWDGKHGLNCSGSGQGQVGGACECGNEPLVSIKCGNFLIYHITSHHIISYLIIPYHIYLLSMYHVQV